MELCNAGEDSVFGRYEPERYTETWIFLQEKKRLRPLK